MSHKQSKSEIKLLLAAKELFWKYGISRVTIEEICSEAQVSKMTFYRYFNNKEEIALAILRSVFDEGKAKYREIMNSSMPFSEKVKKTILLKSSSSNNISEEFLKDIYNKELTSLTGLMEDYTREMLSEFMESLHTAQANGDIRKDIKIEAVLYFLNQMREYISDDKFLSLYNDPHEAIMDMTNFFFYGILENEVQEVKTQH